MRINDDTLELLGKRFVNSNMARIFGITFDQYVALPKYYESRIVKVVQRTHAINITNGIGRLVPV
ncbi:MAG: hypothetical protein B6I36_02375 [Desulfobacteraceae bacterium 4572_35.1]|nr:MAG: hypothetical protein B6I36_02375 [Desulfobacteraceae bacterium 4572_35.1]